MAFKLAKLITLELVLDVEYQLYHFAGLLVGKVMLDVLLEVKGDLDWHDFLLAESIDSACASTALSCTLKTHTLSDDSLSLQLLSFKYLCGLSSDMLLVS